MNDHEIAAMFHGSAQDECKRVADLIRDEIKASPLTPVKTGAMKAGMGSRKTENGAEVTTDQEYTVAVALGHRIVDESGETVGYVDGKPFIQSAVQVVRKLLK